MPGWQSGIAPRIWLHGSGCSSKRKVLGQAGIRRGSGLPAIAADPGRLTLDRG
jgi:hypothetical protein